MASFLLSAVRAHHFAAWQILQIILGIGLLTACSQIAYDMPVPFTLQTLGVIIIGLTMTPRQACATVCSWIGLGAMHWPVFAFWTSGFGILFGHTGGYMWAFALAAPMVSYLYQQCQGGSLAAQHNRQLPLDQAPPVRFWHLLIIGLCAHAFILLCGGAWMAFFYFDMHRAFVLGVSPFIPSGIAKSIMVASLFCRRSRS